MNYMKQIALMLGLEWDDEKHKSELFYIKDMPFICQIRENGCYLQQSSLDLWIQNSRYLMDILEGVLIIKKYTYKPKVGDVFFVPDISTKRLYESDTWLDYDEDIFRLENNFIYRTKEEAIAEAERILKLREEGK